MNTHPTPEDTFGPDVVTAVCRHMNDDHPEDNLLICRALGATPTATRARMTGLDNHGIDFAAAVDGIETPVRIPFSQALTHRPQVRHEVVRMYRDACHALGLTPRDAD